MWFKPAEFQNPNHSAIANSAKTATQSHANDKNSQNLQNSQPVKALSHNFNHPENFAIFAEFAAGLKADDRQKLLDYLAAIGETDQDIINEYLAECGKDATVLHRALKQIELYMQIKSGDTTGLMQCSGCRHLSGNTCQLNGWRVVVDKWRRCNDFELQQTTTDAELITCKSCTHFESHYKHGGGSGSCLAGVTPYGACWWADTRHECDQFVKLNGCIQ